MIFKIYSNLYNLPKFKKHKISTTLFKIKIVLWKYNILK